MNDDAIMIFSTASSEKEAVNIADALVQQELAVCVNVIPAIRSIYRWKGKTWNEMENLMMIKTTANHLEEIKGVIKELHSYELPEILMMKFDGGDQNVLNWIRASVKGGKEKF